MRIPGTKRSSSPDECGSRSGQFAEAVRSNVMAAAWNMLSRETRGVRQGVWATQKGIDLQLVYQVAHDPQHSMFQLMMEDFREAVLKMWPLEDLTDLGIAPTSYIDDHHAFAFLPFGVTRDHETVSQRRPDAGAGHTHGPGGRPVDGGPTQLALRLERVAGLVTPSTPAER